MEQAANRLADFVAKPADGLQLDRGIVSALAYIWRRSTGAPTEGDPRRGKAPHISPHKRLETGPSLAALSSNPTKVCTFQA